MNLQAHSAVLEGRFSGLLGNRLGGTELHDQSLWETSDWVVAPTLGAIVARWLIVVPRHPALNYRSWQRSTGHNPASIVELVGDHLGLSPERLIWFEHGPRNVGTAVGCGVDYAHLHILFEPTFTFDALIDHVRASAALDWRSTTSDLAFGELTGDQSYLVLGSGYRTFVAEGVESTGSQFLRRMVAATVGVVDDWDYRRYPHGKNIAETIEAFRMRACAAATDG